MLHFPDVNYLFSVNNGNTKRMFGICPKLTIKTPDVFIVNFDRISHIVLLFPYLSFQQVNTG